MQRITLPVPVYLPRFLYKMARDLNRAMGRTRRLDLHGDRDIEWSWIAAHISDASNALALEIGPGPETFLGLIAARRGYHVTSVDLEKVTWPYAHPQLAFMQGDVLKLDLPTDPFDLIINCSVMEHVGLVGRYGVTDGSAEGDLEAMRRLGTFLKPGGQMLLTVPVGRDASFAPWHRVYGSERLPHLLTGFVVNKKEFWIKNAQNCWVLVSESEALNGYADERIYGLGCFVLARP